MADEVVAPVASALAPVPAPAATEVAAPVAAPIVVAAAQPPAATPEAATPPAPAPVTPAPDAPTSILSEAKPATTSEAPPTTTPPTPAVETAPATPPPPPVYEAFKLPEGVQLDEARVSEFTKMLGELETTGKADHAQVQAFGQRAVDFFIAESQRQQQALVDSFNTIRTNWRDEIKADPVFGGQNYAATTAAAGALIEQYGGTAEEIAGLRHMLKITGAGDNPLLIKFIARAGKALAQEGRPVPAIVPKNPNTVPKSQRRYGNSLPNGNAS